MPAENVAARLRGLVDDVLMADARVAETRSLVDARKVNHWDNVAAHEGARSAAHSARDALGHFVASNPRILALVEAGQAYRTARVSLVAALNADDGGFAHMFCDENPCEWHAAEDTALRAILAAADALHGESK